MAGRARQQRSDKLEDLKKNIVASYGSCLLKSFESRPLERLLKSDSPEQRAQKIATNKEIIAEREAIYKKNEEEMVYELEKIMARIEASGKAAVVSGGRPPGEGLDAPTTAPAHGSQIHCTQCGNKDENNFFTDPTSGDVICLGEDGKGCGTVVVDHEVHSGAEKRNFEGEEDRNHFGPAPNKLMPDVVNLETSMLTTQSNGKESSLFKRLAQAQQSVEMNLSTIGREDRHTREGYKAKMKKMAFRHLEEVGGNLNLHDAVINRAKEKFADFRDEREAMHNFEGSVLACLALAYEELSSSLDLDRLPRPAAFVSPDSRLLDNLPPVKRLASREEQLDDVVLCTEAQSGLGRFSFEAARHWLQIVASSAPAALRQHAEGFATHLSDRIAKEEEDGKGKERRGRGLDDLGKGIFGVTTVSQRMNRYGQHATSTSSSHNSMTAGKILLRFNLAQEVQTHFSSAEVSREVRAEIESLFKEAILRRTQYDKALQEQEHRDEEEKKRLMTEENNAVPAKKRRLQQMQNQLQQQQQSLSASATTSTSQGEEVEEEELQLLEVDLEDLVGGTIRTLASNAASSSFAFSSEAKAVEESAAEGITAAAAISSAAPAVQVKEAPAAETVKKPRRRVIIA